MSNRQSTIWTRVGIVLAIWTAIAIVMTGQAYLIMYLAVQASADLPARTPPMALSELFLSSVTECFIWAMLTLGIIWLARRFSFGQGQWLKCLAIHIVACLICGFLEVGLSTLAAEFIRREFPKPTITANVMFLYFVAKLNNNIFFYWAILAIVHVVRYYRQFRERELLSAQLETKLAQTQLQILKMQLQPHFLFNTLNAISALIHQDVELADRMIARLGDLLRATLDTANQQEVPLQQELDFIEPYLEIEKARLGQRLTVDLNVEPAVLGPGCRTSSCNPWWKTPFAMASPCVPAPASSGFTRIAKLTAFAWRSRTAAPDFRPPMAPPRESVWPTPAPAWKSFMAPGTVSNWSKARTAVCKSASPSHFATWPTAPWRRPRENPPPHC